MNLRNKHVLILGLGESGLAAALWCTRQGARLTIADTRANPPGLDTLQCRLANVDFHTGELEKSLLDGIDLLVLAPGLSPGILVAVHARAQGIPVVGEIELFAWALRDLQQHVPLLAITGTNGKTTTTALTGHLIAASGRRVGVAGNISPAALTALMGFLDQGSLPECWVLELSSFQLETTQTLNPTAAAVLNLSDDHLDRYIDLDDYASTKARIFAGTGAQVLNRQDAHVRRMAIPGRKLISFGLDAPAAAQDFGLRQNRGAAWLVHGDRFLMPVSDLPLAGLHNAANALAALALCAAIGIDPVALLPALRGFKGLAHRVEKVTTIAGVTWYDDSKGTNVGATVAALEGIGGQLAALDSRIPPRGRDAGREGSVLATAGQGDHKIVLIAGGDGKGQDFSPLKAAVAAHARAVVLIGRDGPVIGATLAGCGVPVLAAPDMDTAVRTAATQAQAGDAVLLSPACASYDMFRNYAHRADVFRAALAALPS